MTTLTITVWHNVTRDHAGRPTAMLDGYRPGDPMVCVFRYQVAADRRRPEAIAEDAFAAFNGHPASPQDAGLARRYYQRRLRSLSVGDVVTVGETPLVCERAGWAALRGGITEARIDEHGTHPPPPAVRWARCLAQRKRRPTT
jgi:hypothetical protein